MDDEAHRNALIALGKFRGIVEHAEKNGVGLSMSHSEAKQAGEYLGEMIEKIRSQSAKIARLQRQVMAAYIAGWEEGVTGDSPDAEAAYEQYQCETTEDSTEAMKSRRLPRRY